MNKHELISAAAKKSSLTKKDTERALNALLDTITDALTRGENVQLIGFGTFEVKVRAPRTGRNPNTNAEISIPARRTPSLRFCKRIKDAITK